MADEETANFTTKQLDMWLALKTDLQRNVVLMKLHGLNDSDAYIAAGGTAVNDGSIRRSANSVVTHCTVKALLNEFKQQAFRNSIMTRDEMAATLTALATTKIDDVLDINLNERELIDPETGEIVVIKGQTSWSLKEFKDMKNGGLGSISELSIGKDGYKIKQHSQLAAAKQLAALMGYEKPQQVEILTPKSLSDFYNDDD